MSITELPAAVSDALGDDSKPAFDAALEVVASAMGAVTATLHRAVEGENVLVAVASRGLPERVERITARIPYGKGMAGLCAERQEAVTVCNLQTDESGTARPGAKETGVAGAIVVPAFGPDGRFAGTLGIGKPQEHDYTDAERTALFECARAFARQLAIAT